MRIDDLQPGMMLSADARDGSGRLLLGAGTEITAKHIGIFRTWGLTEITVECEAQQFEVTSVAPIVDLQVAEAALAEIELRFKHAGLDHPVMVELLRLCVICHGRREETG